VRTMPDLCIVISISASCVASITKYKANALEAKCLHALRLLWSAATGSDRLTSRNAPSSDAVRYVLSMGE